MRALDVSTSWMASIATLGRGMWMAPVGPRPTGRLVLYEFEGCPFCRRVREAVCMLDLEVELRPCPKGGERFRPEAVARGGKAPFPYLVDEGAGIELYESAAIVRHLFASYGTGKPPWHLLSPLTFVGGVSVGLWRAGMGIRSLPSKAPTQPLSLYGFESSPYTRIVREALCELELPYTLHTTPMGSARWRDVRERGGKAMVPYLIDPDSDVEMHESAAIKQHLYATWGA
jgi:glutathione S-transferase